MNSASHWLVTYLLNAIWQVALIAAASTIAGRIMTSASWRTRHLLSIAALMFAVLLPGWSAAISTSRGAEVAVRILPSLQNPKEPTSAANHGLSPHHYNRSLPISTAVATTLASLFFAFVLYRAAVLLWKWRATQRLLRDAIVNELPEDLACQWRLWKQSFGLGDVRLLVSAQVNSPVTLGFRRPALLVPPDFVTTATREEMAAALCHELAHITRRDFLVNLLLEILSLPIAFHPATWLLKKQIDESRELICDAMAARVSSGPEVYARALLGLAQSICAAPAPLSNALGIFEANILEKRIMNLIAHKPASTRTTKFISVTIGCSVLAAACAAISVFSVQPATAQAANELQQFLGTWKSTVNGQPAAVVQLLEYQGKLVGSVSNGDFGVDEKNNNAITGWNYGTPGGAPIVEAAINGQSIRFKTLDDSGPVSWALTLTSADKAELRVAEALPNGSMLPAIPAERVAATPPKDEISHQSDASSDDTVIPPHLLRSVDPEYTSEARAAKFSGKCVVALVIDENGIPQEVHVVKPVGMGLDENAVKAVKQYRFTPAMKDGTPVSKAVKIEVNFRYY